MKIDWGGRYINRYREGDKERDRVVNGFREIDRYRQIEGDIDRNVGNRVKQGDSCTQKAMEIQKEIQRGQRDRGIYTYKYIYRYKYRVGGDWEIERQMEGDRYINRYRE